MCIKHFGKILSDYMDREKPRNRDIHLVVGAIPKEVLMGDFVNACCGKWVGVDIVDPARLKRDFITFVVLNRVHCEASSRVREVASATTFEDFAYFIGNALEDKRSEANKVIRKRKMKHSPFLARMSRAAVQALRISDKELIQRTDLLGSDVRYYYQTQT